MKSFRLAFAAASLAGVAASLWSPDAAAAILQRPRAVSAFYTPDDGYMHAIVAQTDGSIREVYFLEGAFVSSSVIASFSGVVGVTAYYTPVDGFRHAVVALANGQIWEVYYQPKYGITSGISSRRSTPRSSAPSSPVAGWVTPDTTQNLAVATSGGSKNGIFHFTYFTHPITLEGSQLGAIGETDITAWSSTDQFGTTNYISANGWAPEPGDGALTDFLLTFTWPATGSLGSATVTIDPTPSGPHVPLVSLGGIANPRRTGTEDVLYIDGNANLMEEFDPFIEESGTATFATPLAAPGISLGAAIESNGRRHAIVATGSDLFEAIARREWGAGRAYWLGTY